MILVEYRIVLPMTVDEYYLAQLYAVAQASVNETGGGDGLQVLMNDPFDFDEPDLDPEMIPQHKLVDGSGQEYKTGQFTHKIYHISAKIPRLIRAIAPTGSMEFPEHSWNAYPYIRTIIKNNYMKHDFQLKIESVHLPDCGTTENAHGLTEEQLKKRVIINIDIANDHIESSDYKPDEDPSKFYSQKLDRGPLRGNWKTQVSPVMCCYKLLTAHFKLFGFQGKVESMMQRQEQRIFTNFHRQLWCWADRWAHLSIDDIRRMEDETQQQLDVARTSGDLRGMTVD